MSNARIGVDASGMKNGLKQAKDELKKLRAEFKEASSAADLLNKKEDQLNKKMDATKKVIDGYNKVADEYKKKIQEGERAVDNLTRKKEELKRKLEEAKNATNKDEKAISDLTKELDNCQQKLKKENEALERNNNSLLTTQAQVNKLEKSYNDYEEQLNDATDATKLFGTQTMSAQDAMDKLGEVAGNVKDKIDEITDSFEDLIKNGITKTADELVNLAKKTEEYGVKSETALAKAQTLLSGDMYEKADGIIREQTKMFGADYADIAEGWYTALSAAVPNGNIADFTETAGKLSVAGFTDSNTSIDALTTIINAFKLSHDEASRLASILINTQNLGKTTVGELGSEISTVAATASLSGVSFEDLMTAVSYTTQGGIVTNESMTALNAMFREFSDVTSNASKVLVKTTGKTFEELMKEGYNLRDALEVLGNSGEVAARVLGEDFIITKSKLDESLFENAKNIDEVMEIAKANGADLSVSIKDLFSNVRSSKVAGALFDQTNPYDYGARKYANEQLDDSLLEQQFAKLIATTEYQKAIFKQTWNDVLVEMWQGGDATNGLKGYFGEALAEINDLSNEFISEFDFSLIDEIGSVIRDVVIEVCNIVRDNKELILELIEGLSEFIIKLAEYLPEFVENVLPKIAEFIGTLIEKIPMFFNLIPTLTTFITFVINNLPLIMGILYGIQAVFSVVAIASEIGAIVIAFQVLATMLGTTIPAMVATAGAAIAGIAGPVGIAIAVISALIIFFVTLYNRSEEFRESIKKVANILSGSLKEAAESIGDSFDRLLNVLGLTNNETDRARSNFGRVASVIAETLGGALVVIINTFEAFIERMVIMVEQIKTFKDIVVSVFSALKSGDWSAVTANLQKFANLAVEQFKVKANIIYETIEEWDGATTKTKEEKNTTTNKNKVSLTAPLVSNSNYDFNDIMANVNNVNKTVSNSKTPVVNNNNKNVTSNNYFYSPDPIDSRTIYKNQRNMLNEALFTTA